VSDGYSFTIGEQARVTLVAQGGPGDLVPGQFIAITAIRGMDGNLEASLIASFPEELRGTGEGQRPMEGANLMTNATIDAVVDAISGGELSVSFLGSTDTVRLSPDTRVEIRQLGTLADVVPGASITTTVNDRVSGNISVR
jgi:hypothetical protein